MFMQTVIIAMVFTGSLSAKAQESGRSLPSLAPFYNDLGSLVRNYYPEASLTNGDHSIHFEYRARDFMIHEPLMTGDWQDARTERGPNTKGVVCDITLLSGKYENNQWIEFAIRQAMIIGFSTSDITKNCFSSFIPRLVTAICMFICVSPPTLTSNSLRNLTTLSRILRII